MVEFIHTATLLHDDVVDESDLRRGKQTANALFGASCALSRATSGAVTPSRLVAVRVAETTRRLDRLPHRTGVGDTFRTFTDARARLMGGVREGGHDVASRAQAIGRPAFGCFPEEIQRGLDLVEESPGRYEAVLRAPVAA